MGLDDLNVEDRLFRYVFGGKTRKQDYELAIDNAPYFNGAPTQTPHKSSLHLQGPSIDTDITAAPGLLALALTES